MRDSPHFGADPVPCSRGTPDPPRPAPSRVYDLGMRRLLVHGTILLAASCAAPGEVPGERFTWGAASSIAPGEAHGVLTMLETYYADMSARDWSAYEEHFHPGAVLATSWPHEPGAPPSVQVTTLDDFLARTGEGPDAASIFGEWMTDAEVRVVGDLADAWVRYDARFGEPDELMEWSGVDNFSLLRQDGRWRIVSLSYVSVE